MKKKIVILLSVLIILSCTACGKVNEPSVEAAFPFDLETSFPIVRAYLEVLTQDMKPLKTYEYAKENNEPIVRGDELFFCVMFEDLDEAAEDLVYLRLFCADESLTGGVMNRALIPVRFKDGNQYAFDDWQTYGLDVMSLNARKDDAALMAGDSLYLVTVTNRTGADITFSSVKMRYSAPKGHDVTDTSDNGLVIRAGCCAILSFDREFHVEDSLIEISMRSENASAEFEAAVRFGQIDHFDLTVDASGFAITRAK